MSVHLQQGERLTENPRVHFGGRLCRGVGLLDLLGQQNLRVIFGPLQRLHRLRVVGVHYGVDVEDVLVRLILASSLVLPPALLGVRGVREDFWLLSPPLPVAAREDHVCAFFLLRGNAHGMGQLLLLQGPLGGVVGLVIAGRLVVLLLSILREHLEAVGLLGSGSLEKILLGEVGGASPEGAQPEQEVAVLLRLEQHFAGVLFVCLGVEIFGQFELQGRSYLRQRRLVLNREQDILAARDWLA